MAPNQGSVVGGICTDYESKKAELKNPALKLKLLEKAIPKEAFQKSLFWSLFYMVFDYAMWFGSLYAIYQFNTSADYDSYSEYAKWAATLVYWNVSGFFMWGIFVIGHDCGHGTFSNYWLLNDVIGHFCHASIMVPYYPWALSHNRHHMHHNHVDKDYSHPWYTPDKLQGDQPEYALARAMENYTWIRAVFPFVGWAVYLWGMPDGSHFIPAALSTADNRIWNESAVHGDYTEHKKCLISSATVFAMAYAILEYGCNWDWGIFGYYYIVPALVYGWWLVTVTYLQHHDHSTLVFGESDWEFVYSAFETIDRKFGFGIDWLHHHISDGHIVHHLFFRKIPHYNLPIATKAVYEYMQQNKLGHLVKTDDTRDFMLRVHQYFVEFGFAAKRFSPEIETYAKGAVAHAGQGSLFDQKKTK